MNSYLFASIVVLFYLFLYYMIGDLFSLAQKNSTRGFPGKILIGFFLYFLCFQIIALPFKFMLSPLSNLSILWMVFLSILFLFWLYFNRKRLAALFSSFHPAWNGSVFFILLLIGIQLFFIHYNSSTHALWDTSYYVGDVSSSVYTNTISQYDPYTGSILKKLNTEYLLETYQNHSAVMCQVLHLAPLVETRFVMASITVIVYNLLFYQIGALLLPKKKEYICLFLGFLFLLNFFSFNLAAAPEFLFIRPFEGKTILASLILPTVFLYFLKIQQDTKNRSYWLEFLLCILGSFGLNMSAIYMIPFLAGILFVPLALKKRELSVFLKLIVCMIPCVIFSVAYLLTKHYIFIYT